MVTPSWFAAAAAAAVVAVFVHKTRWLLLVLYICP